MPNIAVHNGKYEVKNKQKCINPTNPTYRSRWELHFMKICDNSPKIVRWGSEIFAIEYLKPTDKKIHKYYPDFYIEFIDNNRILKKHLIEIKPLKETTQSKSRSLKTRLDEQVTYSINIAKWSSAVRFCKKRGIEFKLITERELFKW